MAIRGWAWGKEGLHVAALLFQYHVGKDTVILCLSVPVSISLFAISLLCFSNFFSISRYHLIRKYAYSILTKDFIMA